MICKHSWDFDCQTNNLSKPYTLNSSQFPTTKTTCKLTYTQLLFFPSLKILPTNPNPCLVSKKKQRSSINHPSPKTSKNHDLRLGPASVATRRRNDNGAWWPPSTYWLPPYQPSSLGSESLMMDGKHRENIGIGVVYVISPLGQHPKGWVWPCK